jgi:uncharacterized membrane protein
MTPLLLEWLNLLLRWIHVLAGIMWIGDSFLFMWMDSSLEPLRTPRPDTVAGEMWMVHSGGFYEVIKRRSLAPSEMQPRLHWFKWQAYSWISGFFLLGVAYYAGSGVALVDPEHLALGRTGAIVASLGLLAIAWLVYDALWSSALARDPRVAAWISFALIVATAYGLTRLYPGRAAYLQLGAMLGTIMAANVWRRIIPAQDAMLAATRAGTAVDSSLGVRAKARSIHNHYLTLPVLFTMLSNHYPATYGHPLAWLVLVLMIVFRPALQSVMKAHPRSNRRSVVADALTLAGTVALTRRGLSFHRGRGDARVGAVLRRARDRRGAASRATRRISRCRSAQRRRARAARVHAGDGAAHLGAHGRDAHDAARQRDRDDRGRAHDTRRLGGSGRPHRQRRRRPALKAAPAGHIPEGATRARARAPLEDVRERIRPAFGESARAER